MILRTGRLDVVILLRESCRGKLSEIGLMSAVVLESLFDILFYSTTLSTLTGPPPLFYLFSFIWGEEGLNIDSNSQEDY